jgi:hypothetical protein
MQGALKGQLSGHVFISEKVNSSRAPDAPPSLRAETAPEKDRKGAIEGASLRERGRREEREERE